MAGYSLNDVPLHGGDSLISQSVIRDIKLMLVSFIVTCVIIMTYNYSLQQRVLNSSNETKVNKLMLDIIYHLIFLPAIDLN